MGPFGSSQSGGDCNVGTISINTFCSDFFKDPSLKEEIKQLSSFTFLFIVRKKTKIPGFIFLLMLWGSNFKEFFFSLSSWFLKNPCVF